MEQLGTCEPGKLCSYALGHHARRRYCVGWQPVSAPAELRKHEVGCGLDLDHRGDCYAVSPAEYTCPRCDSKISTHICMKAEPVAGETCGKSIARDSGPWLQCPLPKNHEGDCTMPAPAVAAPGEGKRKGYRQCPKCKTQWTPKIVKNCPICSRASTPPIADPAQGPIEDLVWKILNAPDQDDVRGYLMESATWGVSLGRAEGLEEAAKVADSFSGKPTSGFTQGKWWEVTDRIAEAIRALKEKV